MWNFQFSLNTIHSKGRGKITHLTHIYISSLLVRLCVVKSFERETTFLRDDDAARRRRRRRPVAFAGVRSAPRSLGDPATGLVRGLAFSPSRDDGFGGRRRPIKVVGVVGGVARGVLLAQEHRAKGFLHDLLVPPQNFCILSSHPPKK